MSTVRIFDVMCKRYGRKQCKLNMLSYMSIVLSILTMCGKKKSKVVYAMKAYEGVDV
jgi:hypothetical protein